METSSSMRIRLTPIKLALVVILLICLVWVAGQVISGGLLSLMPPRVDTRWSMPIKMENVNSLFRWNGMAVGRGVGGVFHFLNDDGQWIEKHVPGFEIEKNESFYPVAMDVHGPTAIFFDVKDSNKVEAIPSFINTTMDPGQNVKVGPGIPLRNSVQDLFGEAPTNSGFRREVALRCGQGAVCESGLYIPYIASSTEIIEIITSAGTHQQKQRSGSDVCGVFYSADAGRSWQCARVGTFTESYSATIHATSRHLYLLRIERARNLWFSTLSSSPSTWSEPKLLIDTIDQGRYLAEAGNDTLHLCWMDMRLKRGLGFFLYGDWDVGRANNQVFYRNYRDADSKWGKERKLSGSLSHCESPSMSVEDQRIVIAWHNIETLYTRAAIYYATSKDNGRTWSRPTKIKDSENSAGAYPCPKVILHRGGIHMFYNGMYQHREFPN